MIKLMYITADKSVAEFVLAAGADRAFVDMEVIGKEERQGGMNSVKSNHTFEQLREVRSIVPKDKELLVRTNPIHPGLATEVDKIIECGADILMLPYFKTAEQVRKFVSIVKGRCRICLLIENKESAIDNIDEILAVEGVDEYYVGLNDLNLSLKGRFLFEPMANGLLDRICKKLKATSKPFGFGGVARLEDGLLSGANVLAEHYRLGSSCVIMSRTFADISNFGCVDDAKPVFIDGISKLREYEKKLITADDRFFAENHLSVKSIIRKILNGQNSTNRSTTTLKRAMRRVGQIGV